MVLVFVIYSSVIIITILLIMIILSSIRVKIDNLEVNNIDKSKSEVNPKYKVIFCLYFLNKIKLVSFKLDDKKVKKLFKKIDLQKVDFKNIEKDFKSSDLKQIKKLKPKISYLNFNFKLGFEDVIVTTFSVFVVSTIISILLPFVIKEYHKNNYYYKVLPLYINKNVYKIKLDCIIELKVVHIINIIYILTKKRRVDKYEQRSSNRRSYGYSYE